MDQSNTGQKPKKDPLNKHLLSTFKDVTDYINELAQLNNQSIMTIAKRNELLADGLPADNEEKQLDIISEKKKTLLDNLKVKLDKQFSYLLVTPEKYFMRFNWKYIGMNIQVRDFINNFALEKGLKVKLIDDDLVVYTKVDTENHFSMNVTIREANVRNPDRVFVQEEIVEAPLIIEQIDDQVKLLPPDPIRDVIIEADSREDAPKFQICLKFSSPDDCGHPIDNYRVVLVDKVYQGQILPKLTIIKEFFLLGEFQSVYLQFGNDIKFNELVTIQLQAHNKVGWSLVEKNILLQHNYQMPYFLYIQGVNIISVEAQTQIMEIILSEDDYDMQDHFTPINFEIINFSTKFNNYALVDPSFRVCQWGEVLVNNDDVLAIEFDPETSLRKKLDPFLMIVDPFHLSENRYPITKLACGKYHTLGVTVDGKLVSWGLNAYGQLGIGNTTSILIPSLVKVDKFITDAVATKYGSACLDIEGNTYSWGQRQDRYEGADCVTNSFNEVINYQCSNKHTFFDRPRLLGLRARYIGAGWNSFIAISVENWVYQWGENQFFEFGFGHNKDEDLGYIYHLLNPMNMNVQCDELRMGAHHVIIRQGNKFLSWGWNNQGQCGQIDKKDFVKRGLVQIPDNKYKDFSCGFNHSSFLTADNKIIQFGMPNAEIKFNANSINSGTNCTFILGDKN